VRLLEMLLLRLQGRLLERLLERLLGIDAEDRKVVPCTLPEMAEGEGGTDMEWLE